MGGLTWIPVGLIGILSWSVWFIRRYLSHHHYRETLNDFRCTTSLVVPVYREDPEVLQRCLTTWLAEAPDEIILVVDDRDDLLLKFLDDLDLPTVRIVPWRHTGKRGALGVGVRLAVGDLIVFSDSDTSWRPGLLAALQMPFVDPRVGGVGSRQHVLLPASDLRRRVAYWMLNTRYLDYVPAMSRGGGVACLSGRTAAYRRSAILPMMPVLEHEMFLGRQCVAGDDGRLTWLVLAAGYRTVHQASAEADSMFPDSWQAFSKQRIRWSRNSYRCYLTAMAHGWLWHRPLITQITVMQILLTPLTMAAAVFYLVHWTTLGWQLLPFAIAWAILGRTIRSFSHLRENPRDIVLVPLMTLVEAVIALPIKLWAACTMNKQGWLTRVEGDRVQGQSEIHPDCGWPWRACLAPAETGSTEPGALPTLAVTPQAAPYTLAELRSLVPAAFAALGGDTGADGPVLLTANLQVPRDATVVIDTQTPDVRLTSTPSGFATIISRGSVEIAGAAGTQVRISSWDPGRGRVDGDSSDGRSFIAQIGGRMDVTHAVLGYLGFNLGLSSGVAWSGASASTAHPEPVSARGAVISSLFVHNYFGAYTRDADRMVWTSNIFADNEQYGFDPHDFSNNFIVAGNVSYHNGKHGFIFSRGCTHNLLVRNIAYGNGGHGFMIDDGRSLSTDTAQTRIDGSNDNLLLQNSTAANAGNGVEIEGGTGNIVDGNRINRNYIGVRIKDGASASVRGNTMSGNLRYGVDIRDGDGTVGVTRNTINGSWGAINLATDGSATLGANSTADVSASLVVAGAAVRETTWFDTVATVLRWNPMLVLWSVVLGVPIIVGVVRFSLAAGRARRRRTPVG